MKVTVKRQKGPDQKPYFQTFDFPASGRLTASEILHELNYRDDLIDEDGIVCNRIVWEYSCMQGLCGACAMVINKVPCLACGVFIDTDKEESLTIEPLTKFPVLRDLMVDRSIIFEHQKKAEMYLGQVAEYDPKLYKQQYNVSKCLKCGLCLEVCPNYVKGDNDFFGALFANDVFKFYTMTADRKQEINREYKEHFEKGCSKSLACRDICPMNMPTLSSISYMNRARRRESR